MSTTSGCRNSSVRTSAYDRQNELGPLHSNSLVIRAMLAAAPHVGQVSVKAKQSFREFRAAQRTIAGYEALHMIRKGQARWVSGADVRHQNQFIDRLFDLAV